MLSENFFISILFLEAEKKSLFEWPECKWKDVEEVESQGADDNHVDQVTVWELGIYEHVNANLGSIQRNFPIT